MNFIVKLKDGVYFDSKSERSVTSNIDRAQRFHSKSIAKRVVHQSSKNSFDGGLEIVSVKELKQEGKNV